MRRYILHRRWSMEFGPDSASEADQPVSSGGAWSTGRRVHHDHLARIAPIGRAPPPSADPHLAPPTDAHLEDRPRRQTRAAKSQRSSRSRGSLTLRTSSCACIGSPRRTTSSPIQSDSKGQQRDGHAHQSLLRSGRRRWLGKRGTHRRATHQTQARTPDAKFMHDAIQQLEACS